MVCGTAPPDRPPRVAGRAPEAAEGEAVDPTIRSSSRDVRRRPGSASFASGGTYHEQHFVSKLTNGQDEVEFDEKR